MEMKSNIAMPELKAYTKYTAQECRNSRAQTPIFPYITPIYYSSFQCLFHDPKVLLNHPRSKEHPHTKRAFCMRCPSIGINMEALSKRNSTLVSQRVEGF